MCGRYRDRRPPDDGRVQQFAPMARWTIDDVNRHAPDPKSLAAARKLARPGPWSDTGSTDTLVWGKCQGSGSTPYQVSVDLTGPAFKCTCPSRKFPCKHGLALLLLWVDGDGAIEDVTEVAGFASDWQADRVERAARTVARADRATSEPADPEARAKRLAQRLERMDAGVDDFERWLCDLVRDGLAGARQRTYEQWDATAARLVDAQLPGLADRVRSMGGDVHRRADWTDHLLTEIGRWFLAVSAWRRRDELATSQLGDLRTFLGWSVATDEVLAGRTVDDTWHLLGVHRTDDGRLQAQRSWIRGTTTGETAVVLDFAAVGGALRTAQVTGSMIAATVAFHEGAAPARATFVGEPRVTGRSTDLPAPTSFVDVLDLHAGWIAANPLVGRLPAVVRAAVAVDDRGSGLLVDVDGAGMPLAVGVDPWPLLAITGGHPTDLFVELDQGAARPLSVVVEGSLVAV